MELKDFIKEAISSIAKGISESQKELGELGVIVNPERLGTGKSGKHLKADGWRYVQELEFEVNVSIENQKSSKAGGGLTVLGVANLGANVKSETGVSNTNKLKFKVPVAFTAAQTPDEYKIKRPENAIDKTEFKIVRRSKKNNGNTK